jgi:hypothetical protein
MPLDQSHLPVPAAARATAGRLLDKKRQRTLAKAGVVAALGVLVWTGMARPRRRYMQLHTLTGMALIGFTLWHWSLYGRAERPAPSPRAPARGAPAATAGAHGAKG